MMPGFDGGPLPAVSWTKAAVPPEAQTLFSVWGSAHDDVWALGIFTKLRFNGTTWSGSNDVWAVGSMAIIHHP